MLAENDFFWQHFFCRKKKPVYQYSSKFHCYIFDTKKKVHDRKWIILGQTCLAFTRSPLLTNISSIQSCSKSWYFYPLLPLWEFHENLNLCQIFLFFIRMMSETLLCSFHFSRYQVTHQSLLHFVHWISETQLIWNFCYCLTDPTLLWYQIWHSDDHLVSF